MFSNPYLILQNGSSTTGQVGWESPSNIALIKYWGKYGHQLPKNPSLSITLRSSLTRMRMSYKQVDPRNNVHVELFFNGLIAESFQQRIEKVLNSVLPIFPFLKQLELTIETENTFPHSAGIASSASSLSALALCLCSMEKDLFGTLQSDEQFFRKAAYIARLGSGSACRSVYGGFVSWGATEYIEGSTNEFSDPFRQKVHSNLHNLNDAILIVDTGTKKVSSSQGHALMTNHPFATSRFIQAGLNLKRLLHVLQTGEFSEFTEIVENEALSLHAMMLTSMPSFILMSPATIHIINKIQFFRKQNKVDLCFTLDAGPNIHLIYPESDKMIIREFISSELETAGDIVNWIDDGVGQGPVKLKE